MAGAVYAEAVSAHTRRRLIFTMMLLVGPDIVLVDLAFRVEPAVRGTSLFRRLIGDVSNNFPAAVALPTEYVHSAFLRDGRSRCVSPRDFERPCQSYDRQTAGNQ